MKLKKTTILIFLIILVVLSSSFATAVSLRRPFLEEEVMSSPIEILSSSCTWESDHFNACVYTRWQNSFGDYAQMQISGGEALANSPKQYFSPFSYCQAVGKEEGKRAISAFLLGYSGAFKSSADSSVMCRKSKTTTIEVTKKLSFRIQSINSRAASSGTFQINGFPGIPVSCDFEGTWFTDNAEGLGSRLYCDKAGGTFTGHADLSGAYSTEDPGAFKWDQKTTIDPPPHTDQNYFFRATTCDTIRYSTNKNYARAYVINFEKDGMLIGWDYFNDDTRPIVDLLFTMTCKVIPDNAEEVPLEEESSAPTKDFFSQPEVVPERQEERAPAQQVIEQKETIWSMLGSWFRKVFLK